MRVIQSNTRQRRLGFTIIEMMIGIVVTAAAVGLFASLASSQRVGSRTVARMADMKQEAGAALAQMRAGHAPASPTGTGVTLAIVQTQPAGNDARWQWVELRASRDGVSATLWGMVPVTATEHLRREGH